MIESVEMVIRQPGFPDRTVALHEGATRIGRSEDNEVVLSDVGVSRRHAQVYWSGDECLIEDLGSGNGTYHHGQRIQSQPLADGDEVVIDPFVLAFRIRGSGRADAAGRGGAEGAAGARLEVVVGTGMAGSSYPIQNRGLTIGRAEDRDVVIPDSAVSRHHCHIQVQGGRYTLKDTGSQNGVYVNSVKVRERALEHGDVIQIGNTEMRFVLAGAPAGARAAPAGAVPNAPGYTGQVVMPSAPPAPRASRGSSVWLLLTGMATMAGLGMLVVIALAGGWYFLLFEPAPTAIPPRTPVWSLQLPSGLEGGTTESMFKNGVSKMKKEDYKGALQDFYRVLQADPSSRNAKKFALAAGEFVVFGELEDWLAEKAKQKKQHLAERDRLLARARRGGRLGRNATAALREKYREDPVVIREMGWDPTDAMRAREKAVTDAAQALAAENYAEAVKQYELVLQGSTDPTERLQALAGQKTGRRELARAAAPAWRKGALAAVRRQTSLANAAFAEVRKIDPTNPCAALQPR